MESFIHLRKGTTPHRLHANLDGLKDDELGRGGFTGRTANIYRRHDPTAYRSEGPLRPIDVLSSELKPSDATDADGGPLLMFSNDDCRILLSRRHQPMPFYTRHVDGDLLCFVHQGSGLLSIRGIRLAELGAHPLFLHAELEPEREEEESQNDDAAHLRERNRGAKQPGQNAGVDGVTNHSIGTGGDQLVVLLNGDGAAPVSAKVHARPDGE